MLANLASAYADAINSGKMPNIESAWQYLVKAEAHKAKSEAIGVLKSALKDATKENIMNDEWVRQTKKKCYRTYKSIAMGNPEDIATGKIKLSEEVEKILEEEKKKTRRGLEEEMQKYFDKQNVM